MNKLSYWVLWLQGKRLISSGRFHVSLPINHYSQHETRLTAFFLQGNVSRLFTSLNDLEVWWEQLQWQEQSMVECGTWKLLVEMGETIWKNVLVAHNDMSWLAEIMKSRLWLSEFPNIFFSIIPHKFLKGIGNHCQGGWWVHGSANFPVFHCTAIRHKAQCVLRLHIHYLLINHSNHSKYWKGVAKVGWRCLEVPHPQNR